MGMFSEIKKASKTAGSGSYLEPGLHKVKVNRVKSGKNRTNKRYFVVELEILESTNEEAHPAGSTADWYVNMDGQYPDMSLADVKHFLQVSIFATYANQGALYEGAETPDDIEIEEKDADEACGEEQPFVGLELQVEGKRSDGKKFVKTNWSTLEDEK